MQNWRGRCLSKSTNTCRSSGEIVCRVCLDGEGVKIDERPL